MFTYCSENFDILLDLTGPDNWKMNEFFLEQISLLSNKVGISYVSDMFIEGTIPETQYNNLGSVDSTTQIIFDDMDTDETGVIIISNNIAHIKRWVELGFSTVYLKTENCESYKELGYMPDAIWNHQHFYNFVDNTDFRLTYISEKTGFPNMKLSQTLLGKYSNYLQVPHTDLTADVVFTGRYFTLKDNRNYNHPLSRAIIGFKNNLPSCDLAIKRTFGHLIESFLRLYDSTVSHITVVPPRPNKNSRFTGLEKFVPNRNLEYDLLFSKVDYPSPKKYHTFEEKYQCVYGNIGCNSKIDGHVLLLDDVYTSGATTAECARVLYEAGASKVTVLPLAITQSMNYHKQAVMPVVFDSDGNEYFINFRKSDSCAFWSSKNEEGNYISQGYQLVNHAYLEYHGLWSTKLGWTKEYTVGKEEEVKAIIFDLDNTLLQTNHYEVYRYGRQSIGNLNTIDEKHIIVNPSILTSLKQAGIRVGIVTSSPRNYALKLLSLYQYPFDYLVAARDTLRSKPSPDPLLKCAIKLKVNPEYVLNIGDQDSDIEAGNRARMMNLNIDTVLSSRVLEDIILFQQGLTDEVEV